MGLRILSDGSNAIMYCSSTDWAFGPVFESGDQALAFIEFLDQDPRKYERQALEVLWGCFCDKYHLCAGCDEWILKDCACPHCTEQALERR